MVKVEFKAMEHEAPKSGNEWLKEAVLNDRRLHYQLTGKDSEMVDYNIRYHDKQGAEEVLKELIFLMDLWTDKEVPEWYTRDDLKRDIARVEAL